MPYLDEEGKTDIYTQMDCTYNILKAATTDNSAGGLIWEDASDPGGWSSLFTNEGDAVPTLAVFKAALGGSSEAIIDPYKFGGDTGMKDKDVTFTKVNGMSESSVRGVDVSSYIALQEAGVKFYDNEGNEAPLFKVLKDNGVNYIRIRIWNDPYTTEGVTYGGGHNDVETGLKLAEMAKEYDMKVLLCFHYSDFWADPVQQLLPKAWKGIEGDHDAIAQAIYEFTAESLDKFNETGVDIGMVQVGNEITRGMAGFHTSTLGEDKW